MSICIYIYIGIPGMLLMEGEREERKLEGGCQYIEGRMKLPFAHEMQASK